MAEVKNEGRITKSTRNFIYGFFSQMIGLVLNFVVRTYFIQYLGIEYLGINGLFSNILTVLSLAELGFGTAMIYSMYRPLAHNDTRHLQALMNLYRKVYHAIGVTVTVLGFCVIPFFDFIIKDAPDIDHLVPIYLLFLGNSVSSYFYAYKRSLLYADQKSYVCSRYRFLFLLVKSAVQILVLVLYSNFILFLIIQIAATLAENIYITNYVNRHYPYIKIKNDERLEKEEFGRIKKDVYALILSKISHVAINGTSNIIISAVVGVIWVGLYSNYVMITGAVIMILSQIAEAIRGSVGNYIVKESPESHYALFRKIDFLNFWMYGFATITLFVLVNPFITLWIGAEYTLSMACVAIIALNFMLEGFLNSLWTFRTTMGLFTQGRYRPVIAAVINVIFAIILGKYWGIAGVLLGTTLSRLLVNVWFDPYIIFKHGFNRPAWSYMWRYMGRISLMTAAVLMITLVAHLLHVTYAGWGALILMAFAAILITNAMFLIVYRNNSEFRYFLQLFRGKILQTK